MNTLIITFELANQGHNFPQVVQKIKEYPSWARINTFCYLILTDSGVVQVRDHLASVMQPNDNLFVGVCPVPSAWRALPQDVAKWILENQAKHS
jgi:hypothetical protein